MLRLPLSLVLLILIRRMVPDAKGRDVDQEEEECGDKKEDKENERNKENNEKRKEK